MSLSADEIRDHLKEFYGFQDEYNKRYKTRKELIKYVYRLSRPSIKPHIHVLREEATHIFSLDITYRKSVERVIGVNNTKITRNSNFDDYSYTDEYPEYDKNGKFREPPAIRCNIETATQLDYLMFSIFGLKPSS